jgi:uncharacterized membrane protein YiaA
MGGEFGEVALGFAPVISALPSRSKPLCPRVGRRNTERSRPSAKMQEASIFWLRVATALYSIGLLHALVSAVRRHSELLPTALGCFSVATILHMVALVELWFGYGGLPLNNFFESASLCGFLIAVTFLLVYWRCQFAGLSVFVFPVVFFLALLGATAIPVSPWTSPHLRDAWLLSHVLAVMLGYRRLQALKIDICSVILYNLIGTYEHLPLLRVRC